MLTLSGVNTYTGDTTISSGRLALSGAGSIASSPNIVIAGGATFDVVGLTTSLTLASGQGLKGTGSASSGVITTSATKGLTTAANSPLNFTAFNPSVAPLTISGAGTITVASGNTTTVTVSNGGVPLPVGTYTLISKGLSGTVAGTAPTSVTVNGDNIAPGTTASLAISSGNLVLNVAIAPASLKFRSKQTGNWNAASTWETSTDGNTWVNAVTTPDSTNDTINIRNTHIVTVSASVGADQLTVEAGGILSVSNGVSFTIFDGTGTDLTVANTGIFATAGATSNNGQAQINGTLRIDTGGFPGGGGTYAYDQTTGTLLYNHTSGTYGPIDASHVYWPASNGPQNVSVGTAQINLAVARTVGISFATSSGVNGANNLTIGAGGTLTVFAGGFFSGSPTYGAGSLLKYFTGASYGRNGEWSPNATSGAGYPANVQISGNTTLDLPNGSTTQPFQTAGNLTIDSGSALNMGSMTAALTVVGNVTNNGTLTLSSANGGDLKLQGHWSDGGTFNPNGRAVFFEGGNGQTITRAGGETFNYLVINKSAAGVTLASNVTVNATAGNALQITGSSSFPLNLSGNTLTMSGNGGSLLVSGGTRQIGNNGGTLAFTGSKSVVSASGGALTLMNSVTTSLSSAVNFGAGVTTVEGTLTIKSGGSVDTNPPTYGAVSTLRYDTGGTYNTGAEFPSTGVNNVVVDSTTQLNLDSDKTLPSGFATSTNVGSTTSTPRSLTAGDLTVALGSATVTLNNLTVSGFASNSGTLNIAGDWNVANLGGSSASTVNFNGTGAQTILTANTFNNLTASNDVTLGANTTVNGTLALGSKKITTGANTLSLGGSASATRSLGYVIGTLQKSFSGAGSFVFPVGTANGYSPLDANVTAGSGSLSVKPTQTKHPSIAGTNALSRYWTLIGSGITADLTFHYLDTDIVGGEGNYKIFKYSGGTFTKFEPTSLDTLNHSATLNGVSSFSDWTLAESPAVNGELRFSASNYNTAEGNSGSHNVTVTVQRAAGSSGAVSVHYVATNGTAGSGDGDFTPTSGDFNWADGETADKTFDVSVNGDTVVETDETISLQLSSPTGGAALGTPSAATITIQNDDVAPPPAVVYVDDDWAATTPGADPDGAGPATSFGYDAFSKVQDGVNAVASAGTVNVYAGTYVEDVLIGNAGMSLLGFGAGTKTVSGAIGGDIATVHITASNVTVAGFTVTREGNNTTDWNNAGLNSTGFSIQGTSVTNALIRDNVITGNRTGVDINNSNGHTVRNNTIDFNRTGFIFRNQTDQMTVVENFITNNWTVGVLFLDGAIPAGSNVPQQSAAHSTFSNNSISGNWYGQVVDRQSGGSIPPPGTNIKNFRGNWWGNTNPSVSTANSTEPGYAALIPTAYGGSAAPPPTPQPDIAGPASANIKYIPFLLSGTDTNVETAPGRGTNGFQGVSNTVVVTPSNANAKGWLFFDDNPGTGTGTGGFEDGPGTPPLGLGSAFLQVDSQGRYAFGNVGYAGTRMDDISGLSYSSYQNNNANTTVAISLQFDIDYDLNDAGAGYMGRLVFEPYLSPSQGAVQQNTWQTWDAYAGKWYGTRTTVTVNNASVPNPCQPATPCTWQQVLALFPNAGVRNNPASMVLFKAGGPWAPGFDGNVDALHVNVIAAQTTYDFESLPQISINDVTHAEGNAGTTDYTFNVTLSRASADTVTVDYAAADSTATVADGDYNAASGTVTFNPGETSKPVVVQVNGDAKQESDEAFFVNLSNANANAVILDAQGLGTIQNDDAAPTFSIDDVTLAEGDAGTTNFTFTVTKTGATDFATSVDFATADGTATVADSDYQSNSGALNFAANEATKQITVLVNGDTAYEANETFFVNLSNPTGASISDNQGAGTITNDDARPLPNTVYVDDDWAGTTPGADPDGAGPAAEFGYDSFSKVQDGVSGVAPGGTVNVYAGTYVEDVLVNKAASILGFNVGTKTVSGAIGGDNATFHITASNVTIAGFTITREGNNPGQWNDPGLNLAGIAIQGTSITNALIRDNVITANRTGIDINNSNGHTVRNNSITDNRTGMVLRNQTEQLTVVENFITNNWTLGVIFLDGSPSASNVPPQSAAHSAFNNNDLSGNWYGQVVDRQTGGSLPPPNTTNIKNFRGNWWGTTNPVVTTSNSTEPGYSSQIPVNYGGTATPPGGQPDIAGPASANIKYQPVLLSGTDTNVETTPGRGTNGFQGAQTNTVVWPPNQQGWFFFDDNPGTGTGTGGFEEGPGTPPLGVGSAFLQVDSQGRYALGNAGYAGTRMDDITGLIYSSYQNNNANTTVAISLQFDIDYDLNDAATAYMGRLVFEPYQTPGNTVQQNTWQTWDAYAGKWYGTRTTVTVGNASVANPCQQATPCTWQQVLALYPNAGVRSDPASLVLFKAGGPWAPGFDGNVDAFRISVNSAQTTYDFEPLPTASINDVTMAEGDSGTTAFNFNVTLSRAVDVPVTVDYSTADGTATAPSDYSGVAATQITFAPGETSKQVTVNVNGDTSAEADETFFVNLSNPSNATINDGTGQGTITNDDTEITVSVSPSATAEDGAANLVFTFTRLGVNTGAVTVNFAVGGTADFGTDYTQSGATTFAPPTGTINFGPGETSKQVTIDPTADPTFEPDETVTITLAPGTGYNVGSPNTDTGTITNDDAQPSFSIDDVTMSEGNAGTTTFTFTVTKTGSTTLASSVDFATADGSATVAGGDYASNTGTLNFAAGETTKQITVSVNGDTTPESNEFFFVNLSNASGATVSDAQGKGTITNDDGTTTTTDTIVVVPTVMDGWAQQHGHCNGGTSTGSQSFVTGPGTPPMGTGSARFQIGPDGDSFETLRQSGYDGTRIADLTVLGYSTYTAVDGSGGQAPYLLLNIDYDGDNQLEDQLFFEPVYQNGTYQTIFPGDTIPNQCGVNPSCVSVGQWQTWDALSGGWWSANESAGGPPLISLQRYVEEHPTARIINTPAGDGGIRIATGCGGGAWANYDGNTDAFRIAVNGAQTRYDFEAAYPTASIDDVTMNEGNAGQTTFTFTVTLSGISSVPVTVDYATADGTAVQPGDYASASGTLTFAPGETSKQVSVDVNGDTVFETNETFFVNLSNPTFATIADGQGTGTITNDDAAPTFSIDDVTLAEGDAGTTTFTFTVTKTGATEVASSVDFATADGTATVAGGDYASNTGTLNFAANETTKQITVSVNGDITYETNETFFVNLSNPSNATILDGQGLGTITNDDPAPTLAIDDVTHNEGNSGTTAYTFTVTKTGATEVASSVDFATQDGTATVANNDYQANSGTLNFAANETTKTITVLVNGDTVYEAHETFSVVLSNPVDATITDGTGVGTITNDDLPPATLVVNTTDDNDDGFCLANHCSLREAINAANVSTDTNTINFGIPESDTGHSNTTGVFTISPTSALPTVTRRANINGYTQPCSTTPPVCAQANTQAVGDDAVLLVELDGTNAGAASPGLNITGANSTVRGLVINRFSGAGISIATGGGGTTVAGNFIGTDAAGTAALPNGDSGLNISVGGNTVGGTSPADRNILSGNTGSGVLFSAGGANTVQGNYIGTDKTGTLAVGNTANGVASANGFARTIGGSVSGAGNLISGNAIDGVVIFGGNSHIIQGNLIGTKADGTTALGNGRNGVVFLGGAVFSTVGGTTFGEPNTIAFNGGDGIQLDPTAGIGLSLRGNSVFSNGTIAFHLGIDLGNNGVTPNDPQDPDTGPNNLQNFPVITSAVTTGTTKTITGNLNSTPGQAFQIDLYTSPSCDPSAHGEGKTYIGTATPGTTNGNGDVTFIFHPASLSPGEFITATATDPVGNTSEFSKCFGAAGGNSGEVQFASATYSVAEDNTIAVIQLTRVGGSDGSISATFSTSDGTATAGQDYTAVTQTVTFFEGETNKTVNVAISDDSVYEGAETVNLSLTTSTALGPGTREAAGLSAVLTITDTADSPVFSVNDVTHAEGNAGTTTYTFTVTKTGTTNVSSSVNYSTADGTATVADNDYQPTTGTLTFAAGETTKQFNVLVNGDTVGELDETFLVQLSDPVDAVVGDGTGTGTITNDDESVSAGQLVISEFRLRGPGSAPTAQPATERTATTGRSGAREVADTSPEANDEFIELYNTTNSPLLVTTTDGSPGWAVAASDGVVRFAVPNGTIIPAHGHVLGVNTLGYSLSGYPAGNDGSAPTTAQGDPILLGNGSPAAGYTLDIPDNMGIAVFRSANAGNLNGGSRLDSVGSAAEADPLYKEGTGYPALTPADIALNLEHSFYRSLCSFTNAVGCATPGVPRDSQDNATDFLFVDTEGTQTAAGKRLGAPSPENLSSHIQRNSSFGFFPLDRSKATGVAPNRDRDFTPGDPNTAPQGTLTIRRRVKNTTGAPVAQLRFRIIELTTYPNTPGVADLRAITSGPTSISNIGDFETCSPSSQPCTVTVQGTTLETPPNQPNGGGYNASLAAGTITLTSPLANGDSINLQFVMGVVQSGTFRFLVNIEALNSPPPVSARPMPRQGRR